MTNWFYQYFLNVSEKLSFSFFTVKIELRMTSFVVVFCITSHSKYLLFGLIVLEQIAFRKPSLAIGATLILV